MSIYIVPTWHCNLHCPHCFVHTYKDDYNKEAFFESLKQLKEKYIDEHFVLHGGEPTLYKDRYYEILDSGYINSICSNLIVDDEIINDLNHRDIDIATSWNPNRFNIVTYNIWLSNIGRLKNKPLILITIDQDLIKFNKFKLLSIMNELYMRGVREVLFEPLVDNSLDDTFQHRADMYLCDIHKLWKEYKIPVKSLIEEQILDWDMRCDSKTLYPNGEVKRGCILGDECHKILDKCLHCQFAKVCKPCVLHNRCSFYPEFYKMMKNA